MLGSWPVSISAGVGLLLAVALASPHCPPGERPVAGTTTTTAAHPSWGQLFFSSAMTSATSGRTGPPSWPSLQTVPPRGSSPGG
jgi:hypothetical protein